MEHPNAKRIRIQQDVETSREANTTRDAFLRGSFLGFAQAERENFTERQKLIAQHAKEYAVLAENYALLQELFAQSRKKKESYDASTQTTSASTATQETQAPSDHQYALRTRTTKRHTEHEK